MRACVRPLLATRIDRADGGLDPINVRYKASFVAHGFAVVSIDVRGTGASGGSWEVAHGPAERSDALEVMDWMLDQPWCDGRIGLWGIRYREKELICVHTSNSALAESHSPRGAWARTPL